jgi:L-ascorbate metabolism protein UlaG (beta-lactamase superfamily)
MTYARITHIGGPTALIEVGGWWLLTDPTFDTPGGKCSFGWGSTSHKTVGPAIGRDTRCVSLDYNSAAGSQSAKCLCRPPSRAAHTP